MSLTISKAEGVTVYTAYSNHKSKWPLFCQILGTLCYSPVCSVSQRLKQQLGCAVTALATLQIMIGIMHLGFGSLTSAIYMISDFGCIFLGLGGVITAVGIMSVLAEKFPSPCLVVLTVAMNIVSTALALTAIVFYALDIALPIHRNYWCELPTRQEEGRYFWTTASPAKKAEWEENFERKMNNYRNCQENQLLMKNLVLGLDIMMIVLTVLQLCVTISWCVLNIKALCKQKTDGQHVEDPELLKPLVDQEIPNPVC